MADEQLLTMQMPHSTQAEQAVLGSMLIDADCIKDVMDKLQASDFYLRTNREIFETIYQMFVYSKPIDGVTVAGELEKAGLYTDTTRSYLVQLMEVTPTSANVMEYVRIVQDKALMRQVASAAAGITAMVQEGTGAAGDMLESAEQQIYAIRRGRSGQGMVTVGMVLGDVMSHLAELTASGGQTLPGLSTGLSAVDSKINGLNKSDLLLLAARPGMGKTSMALNIALSAARESGKTVAIFSLEMSKEQLVTRLIASEGLVENTRLITGNLRESDWQRIADAASSLSRMLKIMAKELQVPVLCLSQLSRANEKREDKRPMLSDLRESGAIEQDADIVMFLYRDDYYNADTEKHNVAECIVAKNRHGETGKVELRWMPEYTAFGTLETRYDEDE